MDSFYIAKAGRAVVPDAQWPWSLRAGAGGGSRRVGLRRGGRFTERETILAALQ